MESKLLRKADNETVYDISLDGTFVDAFTGLVCHNTDGFNFELPNSFRYTDENPYIGKGSNREVKLGKAYTGYEADVAEFNDLFMKDVHSPKGVQKMGLGIDEIVSSTINFSRKNYADYFPENPYPKDVKLVGNTVKSKKLQSYISNFLGVGIRLLLQGNGQGFIEEYYKHIDKIYNFRIPLKDIASKGKIKKSLEEYKKDVRQVNKAGNPKSRQVWYELALKEGLKVDNGDTIYYINIGTKKSHNDLKKITRYVRNGEDITKEIDKNLRIYKSEHGKSCKISKREYISKFYSDAKEEVEILFNSVLVPNEIINSDIDKYCDDLLVNGVSTEYNCEKYIDAFNNRIKPLLVCFSKEIRSDILVMNPANRKYFTKEQCVLVSGEPNKESDQDTFEQLMTMEDKEIRFYEKYNITPPFLEECGMGKWEDILNDYHIRMEEEERNGIAEEKKELLRILDEISSDECDEFIIEGTIPSRIFDVCTINGDNTTFMSKRYPEKAIGSVRDIIDTITLRRELI